MKKIAMFDLEQHTSSAKKKFVAHNHQSATNEHYTPSVYIEAARTVLGTIDLDPASCIAANLTVDAENYFTKQDNGLLKAWYGNVWLNPPYGRIGIKSSVDIWAAKLLSEYKKGRVNQAIFLATSMQTQLDGVQSLIASGCVCLTDHRIKFINVRGEEGENPASNSIFVYVGPEPDKFRDVFSQFGIVLKKQ